jgi:hemolysin activation/secretion protein
MGPRIAERAFASFILIAVASVAVRAEDFTLPPVAPRASEPSRQPLSAAAAVEIKAFRFTGNTVFSSGQLAALPEVKRHIGQKNATIEDLEQVRQAITRHYVDAGFVNSGAVLPDQTVSDGVITYQIVEGKLSDIHLTRLGKQRLVKSYLVERIELGQGPPLNLNRLRDQLEIIRQDPNIERVNAELKPGLKPGDATLDVAIAETNPYQLSLEFNNKRSPAVGGERFYALASDTNLTGHGDAFFLKYGINTGGLEHFRPAGVKDVRVDYFLPITSRNTTLSGSFTRSDDLVTESPFNTANISSESERGSITLRQPLYRSPTSEFAVSASGVREFNRTFFQGQPFSFSPGAVNGRSDVTVIRLGQEWTQRTEQQSLVLRSTFSIGLDALGSTVIHSKVHSGDNDSRFLSWLGQAQYVRRIGLDTELIFRVDAQLADNPLPALEQFSLGGFDTVRGYRENRIVRDQGVVASAEWRIPIWRKAGRPILDLAPFVDGGYAWNFHTDQGNPREWISSAGVGLLYNPNRRVSLQMYYGYPFKHFSHANDIQDKGFHFDLILSAFD